MGGLVGAQNGQRMLQRFELVAEFVELRERHFWAPDFSARERTPMSPAAARPLPCLPKHDRAIKMRMGFAGPRRGNDPNILIAVVAAPHLDFMYLEMVAWDQPLGRKTFGTTAEFATASKALAANQGLYNGFLVAGLAWGLDLGEPSEDFFGQPRRRRPAGGDRAATSCLTSCDSALSHSRLAGSQRSVSFSSMRRFLTRASSVSAASSGWNSPKPAATSRFAGTPFSIRNLTTEVARADESSQLSR